MWIEDACADVALAAWIEGRDDSTFIRRRAIDAARRYGPHSRYGDNRIHAPLSHTQPILGDLAYRDDWIDLQRAWRLLTAIQRRALLFRVAGIPLTDRQAANVTRARRRLRALCA